MEATRPPRFWELARGVVTEAHRLGLVAPGFRTPPAVPGARRTVRRHPGGALVAVVWRGRAPSAVLADMVDGLVLVNGLEGEAAVECRRRVLAELGPSAGAPDGAARYRDPGRTPLPCPGGGTGQTRGA